jgi:hypothetical protein
VSISDAPDFPPLRQCDACWLIDGGRDDNDFLGYHNLNGCFYRRDISAQVTSFLSSIINEQCTPDPASNDITSAQSIYSRYCATVNGLSYGTCHKPHSKCKLEPCNPGLDGGGCCKYNSGQQYRITQLHQLLSKSQLPQPCPYPDHRGVWLQPISGSHFYWPPGIWRGNFSRFTVILSGSLPHLTTTAALVTPTVPPLVVFLTKHSTTAACAGKTASTKAKRLIKPLRRRYRWNGLLE